MKLFLLFAFNLIFYISYTQSDVYGIEGRFKSGFLLAHRGVMAHLPQHMAYTTELSFYKKPTNLIRATDFGSGAAILGLDKL